MTGGATISPCKRYRFKLWRTWYESQSLLGSKQRAGHDAVLFVMLNPSTADASEDDPTIRKCIGFAKRWGFEALTVVNLYPLRATNPDALTAWSDQDALWENDRIIVDERDSHRLIVAAWGAGAVKYGRHRIERVRNLLGPHVMCLKKTQDGHPWHPLYVPYAKALELLEAT